VGDVEVLALEEGFGRLSSVSGLPLVLQLLHTAQSAAAAGVRIAIGQVRVSTIPYRHSGAASGPAVAGQ